MTFANESRPARAKRIFLSYGHDEHASLGVRLKHDLETHGYDVWFDLDRLKTGTKWMEYIEDGLDFVASVEGEGRFLLLMTPHSVGRPDGFCLKELRRAYHLKLAIIPVMVVQEREPLEICDLQWLDMRDCIPVEERPERYGDKFAELLQALERGEVPRTGLRARLAGHFAPLRFDDLDQHLVRFTGRNWVFKRVDEWIEDPRASRVFWITGEPGVGKSALAAWLRAHRPEVAAFHACRFTSAERRNPINALRSLAYQLSTQLADYASRLNDSTLEAIQGQTDAVSVFEELFAKPLGGHFPAPSRPVVVLIDALDEAVENGRNELASLIGGELARTPPWLRLIITSRPHEHQINFALQALDPWKLAADAPSNLDDIFAYLSEHLRPFTDDGEPPKAVVETIVRKSEGIFLYVHWVREELAAGRLSLNRVEDFPQGLGGAYKTFFERYFPDTRMFASEYRPVLEAICVARESLEVDYLARLFGWDAYRTRECSQAFGSLFPFDSHIRPFHQSVCDWLMDGKRAGPYLVDGQAGHKELADYAWREYRAGVACMARYSAVYLPAHLAAGHRSEELRRVLLDFDWLQAKLDATDVAALISDYDFAADVAPGFNPAAAVVKGGAAGGDLKIVQSALMLSANALGRNKTQLASQLVGRLLSSASPEVRSLLGRAAHFRAAPWLKPKTASLAAPGGPLFRLLAGHTSEVTGVAMTRDGRKAVSGCKDGTLKVWDLERGHEEWTLKGHEDSVTAVAVSLDGKRAVSASDDKTLKVWDLQRGQEERTLKGHEDSVTAVAMTADGKRAVSGSLDHTLKAWDLESGKEEGTLKGHALSVTALAVSIDAKRAVSTSMDYTLKVWDLERGQEERMLEGHTARVLAVAMTADGKRAISASHDKTLKVWDLQRGQLELTLKGHKDSVTAVAMTADGKTALSASMDATLKVWDLERGQEEKTLAVGEWADVLAMTPDGKRALSPSPDGTLKLWDLESERGKRTLTPHAGRVTAVAIAANGKRAISAASKDVSLKVWDLERGQEEKTLAKGSWPLVVAMTVDGKQAVCAYPDLTVWDLERGTRTRTLNGQKSAVNAVAITPDGKRVVSGSADGTLKVWDLETGKGIRTLKGNTNPIYAVAMTADGNRAISADRDMTLKVWDLERGLEERTLRGHTGMIHGVAITADGKRAVSASEDRALKVWDLERWYEEHTLQGHTGGIYGVAMTPDGNRAISASSDRMLRVWDLETARTIATFTADHGVTACALAADGVKIIAGDASGKVHFLELAGIEPCVD